MNRFSAEEKSGSGKTASAQGAKRRRLIWVLAVGVFFGWAGYIFFAQSAAIAEKSEQLAQKQASNDNVTDSLNQLKYDVSRLEDDEYVGQLARKNYNMYPRGEKPIRTDDTEQ